MIAALSKDQELVEFSWDHTDPEGNVKIYYYDYSSKSTRAYSTTNEAAVIARKLWKSLIGSGFQRVNRLAPGGLVYPC